ncbi:hypothetical protein H311_02920 [Anncaliia algerae PRA109]|nr:hypothetical protein H311_02920 [Anncaliia algerae PRA109]
MILLLKFTKAFLLVDKISQKYIKIEHNVPAKLVGVRTNATDFIPLQISDDHTEYALKSKNDDLFLDIIDDFNNIGGTKAVSSEKRNISIILDSNLSYQIKLPTGYMYHDVKSGLLKTEAFNKDTHKGFELFPMRTDKKYSELLNNTLLI